MGERDEGTEIARVESVQVRFQVVEGEMSIQLDRLVESGIRLVRKE